MRGVALSIRQDHPVAEPSGQLAALSKSGPGSRHGRGAPWPRVRAQPAYPRKGVVGLGREFWRRQDPRSPAIDRRVQDRRSEGMKAHPSVKSRQ